MKTKLCFNASDDVDNVGAWVRAGDDGTRISATGTSLDVNVTNDLTVDLDHTEDSVRLGDGTNLLTSTTVGADIGLDVNIINAVLSVDDNGGSLTVDASQLDIDDLNATDDAVSSWLKDGTGTAITSTGGALDVNIASSDVDLGVDDTANADCAFSAASVDNTAGGTDLVGTDLAARKYLFLYNNGNQTVYLGESGVTTATGFPLDPCSYIMMRAGASCDLHAIGATVATQDIRVAELS